MSRHYIEPIILASEVEEAAKHKTITIKKSRVFQDIDLLTHKHTDGNDTFSSPENRNRFLYSPQTKNARSSDINESVDHEVISRYVEFRDSRLRDLMQRHLATVEYTSATDALRHDEETYVYNIIVDEEFNDNTLLPLTEYIHRYLVYGALYDWYSQFGIAQAGVYGSQLDKLEEDITSALRGPSIAKRPLQPFGPKDPINPI